MTTSTKGTSATTHRRGSGARFMTAPIRRPPADPPRAASWSRRRPSLVDERPRDRDEVAEGRRLLGEAAHLVPGAAHLAAAADVGDGEDDPAVEQREPQRRERRVDRDLVAAVAVEEEGRSASVASSVPSARHVDQVAPRDDRDRDAHAVARRHPEPARDVARLVVAAEHAAAACARSSRPSPTTTSATSRGVTSEVITTRSCVVSKFGFAESATVLGHAPPSTSRERSMSRFAEGVVAVEERRPGEARRTRRSRSLIARKVAKASTPSRRLPARSGNDLAPLAAVDRTREQAKVGGVFVGDLEPPATSAARR